MTDDPNDERRTIYKEYRTAKRNLKKGRDFLDWMKIARGYDEARREAMQRAHTNQPYGHAYREEFAKIDRREKLIDRDEAGKEFPDPEARTYMIKVLENYDVPSYDPRRLAIKAWRDKLSNGERAKLNHPKRVWTTYWEKTQPQADKLAKQRERELKAKEEKPDPMLDLVANTEGERDDARRHAEDARELLGRVLSSWEDMPQDMRDAIKRFLAS